MNFNVRTLSDDPQWYAVHTKPKQEQRAEVNLKAWGVKTFAPNIKERRTGHSFGNTFVIKPLFPRYLFANFVASTMLHHVSFTRGVNNVVKFGGEPTAIDDSIIELIKSQIADDGCIKIDEQLDRGDQVLIKSGPFANLVGIFERKSKSSERVMILLATVQYQSHVLVNIEQVKKI